MGSKFRTLLNLEIIKSDMENGLIYIKGSIPGSKNSTVFLRKSKKIVNRKTSKDKFVQAVETSNTSSKKDTQKKETPKKTESKQVKKEEPKKK